MLNARKLLFVAAAAATALVLSGCAAGATGNAGMSGMNHDTDDAASRSPAGDFNDADVMFAQLMIPHHEQAVEMSDLLLAKSGVDDPVIDLAKQIKQAQLPEIDQLREWLGEWGEDESGADGMGDMDGMDHGGMMSDDDMTALENADGAEASRLFLEQMIVHHEGAIDMAKAEIADGEHEDATAMAEAIIAAQTAEIATMQQLLASR
jgi:uncharacterized protein (DUF305 family)